MSQQHFLHFNPEIHRHTQKPLLKQPSILHGHSQSYTKKKTHMVALKSTFDLQLQKIDIITCRTTNKVPLKEGHATSIIKILSVI